MVGNSWTPSGTITAKGKVILFQKKSFNKLRFAYLMAYGKDPSPKFVVPADGDGANARKNNLMLTTYSESQNHNSGASWGPCLGCLRRLGLGLEPLGRMFGLDRSTMAGKTRRFTKVERYMGFDDYWRKLRYKRNAEQCDVFEGDEDYTDLYIEEDWIEEQRQWLKCEKEYQNSYKHKYQHLINKTKERHKIARALRLSDPEKMEAHLEKKRVKRYLAMGWNPEDVPERGANVRIYSKEEMLQTKIVRKKRDHVRTLLRDVWYRRVGDVASMNRVGCTVEEFNKHIESQLKVSWTRSNYGTVWNFDHVRPCAAFDVFDNEQVKLLNHYTNIRPYCVMMNSLKGADLLDPKIGLKKCGEKNAIALVLNC